MRTPKCIRVFLSPINFRILKTKKNVCKAAKAASQKYKKMTWSEALKKAAKSGPRQTKLKI